MSLINKLYTWAETHKLISLFVLGIIIDFWACWYSYAVVHDWIILQAFLGFGLPFLNFLGAMWWIDEKDTKERLKMTTVTAFSMVLGSTLMLLMVREGFGVGVDFIP
jgi:uncharacterized membrane protein YidH (DUF202 family)